MEQGGGVRLLLRMDDAGSCPSANAAISDALALGVARSVGVMAPAPFFAEATQMLRIHPSAAVGVHGTLNAEWTEVKWGPVLGGSKVPSLVDGLGHFHPNPHALNESGFRPEEAVAELEAQVLQVVGTGLRPVYLDEHMGLAWLPGVGHGMEEIAHKHGLLFHPEVQHVGPAGDTSDTLRDRFIVTVRALQPGTYMAVFHPAYDSKETRSFWHPGLERGQIANEREAEARLLTDPQFRDALLELGIETIDFNDLTKQVGN